MKSSQKNRATKNNAKKDDAQKKRNLEMKNRAMLLLLLGFCALLYISIILKQKGL